MQNCNGPKSARCRQLSARGTLLRTGIFYIKQTKTRTMAFDRLGRIPKTFTYLQSWAKLNVSEKRTRINIAISQQQLDKSIRLKIYANNRARGILLLTGLVIFYVLRITSMCQQQLEAFYVHCPFQSFLQLLFLRQCYYEKCFVTHRMPVLSEVLLQYFILHLINRTTSAQASVIEIQSLDFHLEMIKKTPRSIWVCFSKVDLVLL